LNEEKKQQVTALGRLGWSLRRIERATLIRRETVAGYLTAAGIAVRPAAGRGRTSAAKPANEVIADSGSSNPAMEVGSELVTAKPASQVITDFGAELTMAPPAAPPLQPGRR